jgi:hypothetical protein
MDRRRRGRGRRRRRKRRMKREEDKRVLFQPRRIMLRLTVRN